MSTVPDAFDQLWAAWDRDVARRDEREKALRAQLEDLRRAHDTDAATCREALERVEELTAERDRARAEVEVERLQARLEETNDVLGKFIVASDARIAELRASEAKG